MRSATACCRRCQSLVPPGGELFAPQPFSAGPGIFSDERIECAERLGRNAPAIRLCNSLSFLCNHGPKRIRRSRTASAISSTVCPSTVLGPASGPAPHPLSSPLVRRPCPEPGRPDRSAASKKASGAPSWFRARGRRTLLVALTRTACIRHARSRTPPREGKRGFQPGREAKRHSA